MEGKHNPNSHHTPKSWSDLPLDLLILVFQRLSFVNFVRSKTVCSSWLSASRQCFPKKPLPWLIFPKDNNNSCMLLNPEEKDKPYKTQDLGLGFNKSVCKATYGSYLLMQDPMNNLYIVNLFTRDRINLPPTVFETINRERFLGGRLRIKRDNTISVNHALICVDEETKDYIVVFALGPWLVCYSKKGETSWNQIPKTSNCKCMVYKDHKLCFLNFDGHFKIFEISRDHQSSTPQLTFEGRVWMEVFQLGPQLRRPSNSPIVADTKLVMTITGKVLKVDVVLRQRSQVLSFRVFKVNSPGQEDMEESKLVRSLGDEAMLLDQGITVFANDFDGMVRNSIYFTKSYGDDKYDLIVFDLKTQKAEVLHKLDSSNLDQFSRPRWFLRMLNHA